MAMKTADTNKIIPFGATPVLVREVSGHEAFNKALCDHIMALREKVKGENRTNRGGWQSPTNFLETLPENLRSGLLELVVGGIVEIVTSLGGPDLRNYKYRITGWANVSMQGGFNLPHTHPNGIWSAVYYLAGDEGQGGELFLMDPRPQAFVIKNPLSPEAGDLIYPPRNSSIIFFPSWVYHYVTPYAGKSPRINVAFNCA